MYLLSDSDSIVAALEGIALSLQFGVVLQQVNNKCIILSLG